VRCENIGSIKYIKREIFLLKKNTQVFLGITSLSSTGIDNRYVVECNCAFQCTHDATFSEKKNS